MRTGSSKVILLNFSPFFIPIYIEYLLPINLVKIGGVKRPGGASSLDHSGAIGTLLGIDRTYFTFVPEQAAPI